MSSVRDEGKDKEKKNIAMKFYQDAVAYQGLGLWSTASL